MLATAGVLAGVIMGIINAVNGDNMLSVVTGVSSATLSFGLMCYANATGRYKICYLITIVVIFIFYFPFLYFRLGGYQGSKIAFFIFAVVYTAYMLEGKIAGLVISLELLTYTGVFIFSYMYPQSVTPFPEERGYLIDAISNLIFVSIALSVTLIGHLGMYNRQQRELEAARKQAEEYAKMKGELFANMSHEMRTPLTVMSAYAQYAVEQIMEAGANDQTLADLATISDEAKRLAEMADGTLKVLMSSSDTSKYKFEPVDIGSLTGRIAGLFGSVALRKGRRIVTHIEEGMPVIQGDTDASTQLLWNTIQNAVTHS